MGIPNDEIQYYWITSNPCEKENPHCGNAFIVMTWYPIEKCLKEKLKDISITVEEGIGEISSINSMKIQVGSLKYNQIPQARNIGSKLFDAHSVNLPNAIAYTNIQVTTRKKLELKRNKP